MINGQSLIIVHYSLFIIHYSLIIKKNERITYDRS